MKKKALLICSCLLASFIGHAQNQVFYNGFENVQGTDTTALGWYQFINAQTGDTQNPVYSEVQHNDPNCCYFHNDAATEGSAWLRAIKFRNLPLKANTSYRLSFWLKGDPNYSMDGGTTKKNSNVRATVMTGREYADVQLLAADSTKFDYTTTVSGSDWKRYSFMFYYMGYDIQAKYFANHKRASSPDAVLKDNNFVAIYPYNPGDYYLDEVGLTESTIAGISFNMDAIKVDFGYATNIAQLAKSVKTGKLQLSNDCVKVKVNDASVDVISVELQSDGYLYIFLGDVYPESSSDKVSVSFTNPTDANKLLYTDKLRPNSASADKTVLDFSNENAYYDQNLSVTSVAYNPPVIVTSNPENGSFDLPLTTNTYTFNFDKPLDVTRATATLSGEGINNEKLTFSPSTGFAKNITLTRTGTSELTKGEYSINITKVLGELSYSDDIYTDTTITFNLGKTIADPNDTTYVVWKDSFNVLGANYCPNGWTVHNGANVLTPGASVASGPRVFQFGTGGDFTYAMYIRDGSASYGLVDGWKLTLKPGKYQLKYNSFGWKSTSTYNICKVIDASGNLIAKQRDNCLPNVNGDKKAVSGTTASTVEFKIPANGDYSIHWTPGTSTADSTSGWNEVMFGNVSLTYIPSVPGAYYKTMLANALAAAKATAAGNVGSRYAGSAYTALMNAISAYEGKEYTAPSAYMNASNELANAKSTMDNHRKYIDAYDTIMVHAKKVLNAYAGTKYATDASYPALQSIFDKYNGKLLTLDDSLTTAVNELTSSTTLCSNMCNYVIDDLNDRTTMAIETAKKLGIADDDPYIVAAKASITDNDDLVKMLNVMITKRLYKNLLDPADTTFATKTDPNTLQEYVDSINMTSFLKNPNLYIKTTNRTDMSASACPGWTIQTGSGYEVAWSIGWGTYDVSAARPAEDAMLSNWGKPFDISQTIANLLSGIYTICAGFGERNNDKIYNNYMYVITNNVDSDSIQAPYVGQTFPTNNIMISNITVTDGKITVGAKAASDAHVFLNNFALFMKAKAPGFDYTTDVKGITDANATLKKVEYYDLNGRRLSGMARGITIIKWIYNNGATIVTKKISR